jgi:hypothetical protein
MYIPTPVRGAVLLGLAAVLAGCAVPMTSSNTFLVPLSNGETLTMSYNSKGVIKQSGHGVEVIQADLMPTPDKKHITYEFEFMVKSGLGVKDVLIQDMTDEPIAILAHDSNPQLVKDHWKFITPALDPKSHGLEWLIQLDETIRVFRFTVTLNDGTQVVLDQPAVEPVIIKQLIRKMLGID